MKSVLVLEAYGNIGETLIGAIRSEGCRPIVVTHPEVYADYSERLQAAIAHVEYVDFASASVVADLVDIGRRHSVVAVVTGWEFFTGLTSHVASELGLPCNDPGMSAGARNKWDMAKAFSASGVNHAFTLRADDFDDLARQLGEHSVEYPIVVKPAENAGSVGVAVVNDIEELKSAVEDAQKWALEFPHGIPLDTRIIAQSYVGGDEYSIESLASNGSISHLAITEKRTTTGRFRAETAHTVPAPLTDSVTREILAEVTKALEVLGFCNGAAHTEVKFWEGVAWVIEVGLRPAGDHIVKLVTLATGVNFPKAYLRVALGGPLPAVGEVQRQAGVRFVIPERPGQVASVTPIRQLPGIVESGLLVSAGDEVGNTANNISRLAYFIAVANSRSILDAQLATAVQSLDVVVE